MSSSYAGGAMLQGGVVHRPGVCPKFTEEDDVVIRAMCGKWVYDPGVPCECVEKPVQAEEKKEAP